MKPKGRGALSNRPGRFAKTESEPVFDDFDDDTDDAAERLPTELHADASRTIVARNRSPDIPFDQSINPYRCCEHGCIYCYARTTHSYLDLSPGRDFETQIYFKPRAAELLRKELSRPG